MIESNTAVHRKPPFNGSIFGKRSVLPALFQQQQQPNQDGSQQRQSSAAVSFEDAIVATIENYLISQTAATTSK